MPTSPSKYQGRFIWYDLMTGDTNAAQSFYCGVIGWDAKDSGMADRSYTLRSAGSAMVGGLMPIPEPVRVSGDGPRWTGYIAVDDVDGHARRVEAAGGSVHRPAEDIPDVGRFAVVSDPHGAVFILFKGTTEPPAEIPPGTPGRIGWHELHSGNLESAFGFYSGLFGWTKADTVDMGPMGTYQLFATGGAPVGGMMTKCDEAPSPFWLYYFNVEAIDAAVARAQQGGAKLLNGPHQVPGGSWIAHCTDPQGAMFAMAAPRR